ncbi:MAG: sigma-54 dependent transcriptional regulator [Planctomycetota bacterium]|nr:sigma-54 dependent transcriptional regulator [Planctomycetota bacterium]
MDETRELTSNETVSDPSRSAAPAATRESALPHFLLDTQKGFTGLTCRCLEWLAEFLEFERGFFVVEPPGGAEGGERGDPLQVAASRVSKGGVDRRRWVDVMNPEFALNHSVVREALSAVEPVAVDDCLIQSGRGAPEQHRAVLCQCFALGPDSRGVVYLDRGLGKGSIGAEEQEQFATLVESCVPAVARAYLFEEVARLKERIEGFEELDSTGGVDGEPEEPLTWGPFPSYYGIVGRDEKLRKIFHVIEKIKNSGLNVCIFGESGTGKELVARAIHEASDRREHAFVSENCGAIAENLLESELFGHVKGAFTGADQDRKGLFELADKGTLFLDEIGDMSEGMQRKLLRSLQEGTVRPIGGKTSIHVDVRVVCASNRDLKRLVREGSFRTDLYYRLNVILLQLPPVRERREDLPLLVEYFTAQFAEEEGIKKRFGDSATKAMVQYSWPGNVRELRNVIRRVMLTCPRRVVARKDVLPYLTNEHATACLGENLERENNQLVLRIPLRKAFNDIIDECEKLVLMNALKENGWNKSRVTKALGIPRQSLYNKIAKYDLQREWSSVE